MNKLLFFPVKTLDFYPSRFELSFQDVRFRNEEGLMLHGWYFPGKNSNRTLLYLHGNAGNIATRLDTLKCLHTIGWNIFIFDYRGYGGSEGSPTIEGVLQDTQAAYQWLTQGNDETKTLPGQIIVWGESLGGALATELAVREPIGGLILQSTFTSLRDIAKAHYPFLLSSLAPDLFRSIETVRKIKSPLLVIHGTKDETVPFWMGEKLFQAAPHPKRFYKVDGGNHNELYRIGGKEYLSQIEKFLNEAGL